MFHCSDVLMELLTNLLKDYVDTLQTFVVMDAHPTAMRKPNAGLMPRKINRNVHSTFAAPNSGKSIDWLTPIAKSVLTTSTATAVPPVSFAHGKAAILRMEDVALPLALPAAVAPVSANEQSATTNHGQTLANVKQSLRKI